MQPQEDKNFWGKEWDSAIATGPAHPDARTWRNEIDERLMTFLRPYLPKGGQVAEVGCGSGRLLARIGRALPVTLTAVDYSPSAMELVEQSASVFRVKIRSVLADVTCIGFADRSFDLILSGGLLEHFDDPKSALAEMVRILKPGAALFAAVVPRKWFSLHRPMHRWLGPQVYRTRYGPRDYATWLKELGCVDVVTESKGLYPPLFHHLPAGPRRAIERVFRRLDGTAVADRLGYFFVVAGRRGA
ncbi:MAG: methyltransferase domain-containing protein [Thermoanaerobaculia bacterium]